MREVAAMTEQDDERHPSYGAIEITRISGGDPNMFMSDVPHEYRLALRIKEAKKRRSLSDDHHLTPVESIIEVEMSEHQFARLVGSIGIGGGVPCTIRRRGGELVERPPREDKTEVFTDELEEIREELERGLDDLEEAAEQILEPEEGGGYLSAKDRRRLLKKVRSSKDSLDDKIPHLFRMLKESLEGAVHDAQAEIEAQANRLADYLKVKAEKALGEEAYTEGIVSGFLGGGDTDE